MEGPEIYRQLEVEMIQRSGERVATESATNRYVTSAA